MLSRTQLLLAFPLLLLGGSAPSFAFAPAKAQGPAPLEAALPDAPILVPGQSAEQQGAKPSADAPTTLPATPDPTAEQKKEARATQDRYDLRQAEHQRILGVMPEFQAVNQGGVLKPLRPAEKFHLMWKSSTDPFIFSLDAIVAGIGQAKDSNPGFHQGAEGYFKRFGASYADTFDGNFWGNAVLTVAFKEDPRYFREGGSYSYTHRALYSAGTALWTRKDNGKSGPNYANVLGNFISGGISNLYYPAADRGLGKTVTGAVTVTAEGTIGSELIEFWPDIAAKLFPRHYHKQPGD